MLIGSIMLESFKEERESRKLKTRIALDQFLYKAYSIIDIKHEDLKVVKIGGFYDLPTTDDGSIISQRKKNDDCDNIMYEVVFSKNSTLLKHRHSDVDEEIRVLSNNGFNVITGSEKEGNLKETVLTIGDVMVIPKGLQHQVTNMNRREGFLEIRFFE